MIRLTSRERVDAFWSSTLGVDASDLHAPGTRVRPADQSAWRGVYVLSFDKSACVVVPADLLDAVGSISELDPETVLEPDTWRDLLGKAGSDGFGPVVHHYRDERDGLDELAGGRRLNPGDAGALAELRGAVDAAEWAAAGFTGQPAVLFGLFEAEHMVAAANLNGGPEGATDVGIVVHPDARGHGHGLGIAATAARQAILMHGLARFRALASSQSSRALADRLGFSEYGRNLAVPLA